MRIQCLNIVDEKKLDYSVSSSKNFTINDVNDCNSNNQYGFRDGKPCILIKINKVCLINDLEKGQQFNFIFQLVGFIPEIGRTDADNEHQSACTGISNIPVQCIGEVCFKILK